jgi:hypothetical protein
MGHRDLVRPRQHERAHAFLALPRRHGPEGEASIGQDCAGLKSGCASYLLDRPPGVKGEERDKSKGADSEARQANEGHSLLAVINSRIIENGE